MKKRDYKHGKKLVILGIAILMLISLAACEPPNGEEEEGLNAQLSRIKRDYFEKFCANGQGGYTIEDVSLGYYGTYNGYAVVTMRLETGETLGGRMSLPVDIAGFEFMLNPNYHYMLWKDGQFAGRYFEKFGENVWRSYGWTAAYELGLLSQDDIRQIHERYKG